MILIGSYLRIQKGYIFFCMSLIYIKQGALMYVKLGFDICQINLNFVVCTHTIL